MDGKEIKFILKNIKEYLDAKDFKSAIKHCKSVLKSDRSNYLALVFFGVALQETEQKDEAPKAFKKAIEIKPDNNLAWRGLASFYEKFQCPESNQELLKAYERLMVLETEPNKYTEFIKKYENIAITMNDIAVPRNLLNELDDMPEEKRFIVKKSMLNVLLLRSNIDTDMYECKKILLSELALMPPCFTNHLTACKEYLQMLYVEGCLYEVINEGNKILTYYPDDKHLAEFISKAYVELYCLSTNDLNFESFCNDALKILEKSPESYLNYLLKGIRDLEHGNPVNALEALKLSVKEEPSFGFSWFILCKCQIFLYQFADSEVSAQEALKCCSTESRNEKLISTSELWLVQSLCEQEEEEKWSESVILGCKILEKNPDCLDVLPYLIKALIKLNRIPECDKYLEELKKKEEYSAMVLFLEYLKIKITGTISDCKSKLECLIRDYPESKEGWLELGKLHYEEKNSTGCLSCLLKSAKLNQWYYVNFLYLGHCYKDLFIDLDKARRCYQKSFQLNPHCFTTWSCLSEVYSKLGKEDLNGQLLNLITAQNPKLKWGWFSLGVHYLSINEYQNAINSLRVATRIDPNDRKSWEFLADSYYYQGAYVSAAKSYSKVLELGSDSIYPLMQLAVVKHSSKEYGESISSFKEIIDKYPEYVPALKGHAEVCISLMKQCLNQNLNGLAMDNCQEAVNSLMKCLETRRDLSCIWKLLGDACVLFSNLPERFCKLRVPSKMVSERRLREGQKEIVLNRADVLNLGSRSYCEALSLNSNSDGIWYDLAVCYNNMALHSTSPAKKKEFYELASSAVKKSLIINEKNWQSWNLFGIISASSEIKDYQLAQHCFIRALEENDASPVVWTNLGTLYMCLKDFKLANQSFTEAQRLDHNYVQCWIGQAMIAQSTGHHDSMDLFRHSNQLGVHPESSLGYASLVCLTLLETKDKTDKDYIYSIKNMNAVAVACDALTWYTDKITDNPCAFNMLGLLLERQNLHALSSKAFQNAVSLLMTRQNENTDKEYQLDILDKALLNYGRSLIKVGRPEEAITVLKQIRKANFLNQCELAQAYFKAKQYEEAYSSYATTLEWLAPDSGFKSHILVAMAAVVYMHQGKEDAKILLMQACQLKPPSVQGLFACCALGMLHADLSLSELALKELSHFRDDTNYLHHIAMFESYTYLFKGEKEKAIRVLSKAIHRHPDKPSLWLNLSLLLLHLHPSFDSQSAANCAEVTIKIGRSEINISKVMSLVSLSDLLSGKGTKSLRSSQKAVHMFPHETENWVVLVASVLSKCLFLKTDVEITWLKDTIAYIRRKLQASKTMIQWLSSNERKVTLMADT